MPLQGPSGSCESLQGPSGTRVPARPQWLKCVIARPQRQKSHGKAPVAEEELTGGAREFFRLVAKALPQKCSRTRPRVHDSTCKVLQKQQDGQSSNNDAPDEFTIYKSTACSEAPRHAHKGNSEHDDLSKVFIRFVVL